MLRKYFGGRGSVAFNVYLKGFMAFKGLKTTALVHRANNTYILVFYICYMYTQRRAHIRKYQLLFGFYIFLSLVENPYSVCVCNTHRIFIIFEPKNKIFKSLNRV